MKALRPFGHAVSAIATALLIGGCVTEREEPSNTLNAGDKVPAFSVTLLDGQVFSSESLPGKTGVIVFFNTSCPDCRRELPQVQLAYETTFECDQPEEAVFVCIAREEGAASVAAYWAKNAFTLPCAPQTDRSVYNLFASSGIPRIYITKPDGTIHTTFDDSEPPTAETLLAAIAQAVATRRECARVQIR